MIRQSPSPITADWTVNQVIGSYPSTLPVFGRYRIDRCCGGLKSLRDVATAHRLPLAQLLADLQAATLPPAIVLDVRPDIRAGREPFQRIMATVNRLAENQALVLLNDFEPVPLYAVLAGQGFDHQTERTADGGWKITFSRRG